MRNVPARADPTVQNHWYKQTRLCEAHEKDVDSFKGSKQWRLSFEFGFAHLDLQGTVLIVLSCLGAIPWRSDLLQQLGEIQIAILFTGFHFFSQLLQTQVLPRQ